MKSPRDKAAGDRADSCSRLIASADGRSSSTNPSERPPAWRKSRLSADAQPRRVIVVIRLLTKRNAAHWAAVSVGASISSAGAATAAARLTHPTQSYWRTPSTEMISLTLFRRWAQVLVMPKSFSFRVVLPSKPAGGSRPWVWSCLTDKGGGNHHRLGHAIMVRSPAISAAFASGGNGGGEGRGWVLPH